MNAKTAFAAAASACLVVIALAPAADAELSPSAYEVRAICGAPAPGYSSCLGLRLSAKQPLALRGAQASTGPADGEPTPSSQGSGPDRGPGQNEVAAQAQGSSSASTEAAQLSPEPEKTVYTEPWSGSYGPAQLRAAYGLEGARPPVAQQTIALVNAFDDPTIEHDLQVFDEQFGLPACTTANGCFTKVRRTGATTEPGWDQEIATDVEVSHGLCPSCRILLVEASSNADSALEEAEAQAERLGATEISNSWGGPRQDITAAEDDDGPFNDPGVVIAASAGDDGYLNWGFEEDDALGYVDYPAASPHVVAVGGTRLRLSESGAWKEETVWNGYGATGGGCSTIFTAPAWQQRTSDWSSVGCGTRRAVADVSADADPYTGVAVYDSTPVKEKGGGEYSGWVTIGGTSVASPIIASTFALAGGAGKDEAGQAVAPARTLYENLATDPGALHDVVSGSNGVCSKGFSDTGEAGLSDCSPAEASRSCSATAICLARSGYDGPSGVGTPYGLAAFQPPAGAGARGGSGSGGEGSGTSSGGEGAVGGEGGSQGEATEDEDVTGGEGEAEEVGLEGNDETGGRGGSPTGADEALATTRAKTGRTVPLLSAPALTKATLAALALGHPRISQLRFAFTLNVAARVRVTLARLAETHGRRGWQSLQGGFTVAAIRGRDQASLNARRMLTRGSYRLTLAPGRGKARSLVFSVS